MSRGLGLFLTVGSFVIATAQTIPGHDSTRKQVLLLTGYNSTRNHDWRKLSPLLRQILEDTKDFEVRINEEPRALTQEVLRGYDVLLLDYSNYTPALAPPWPSETQAAYLEFLRKGGGVVAYHAACGSFQDWPEYRKSLGIAAHDRISHGPYQTFQVRTTASGRDLLQTLPTQWSAWGEIYNGMRLEEEARILATAFDDPKNCSTGGKVCGSGKHEPVIWTHHYGRGRSVVFTLGHDEKTFAAREIAPAFVSCVRWAASQTP